MRLTVYIGPSVEGLVWEMDADEHWTYTTKWYCKKFVYMNGEIVTSYHDIEGEYSGSDEDAPKWMERFKDYSKYYKEEDNVVTPPKPGSHPGTPSEIQVYQTPPEQPLEGHGIVQGSWKCDINNQWIFEGKATYIDPSWGTEEYVLGSTFMYYYTFPDPLPPLEEFLKEHGVGVPYLTMDNVKVLYDSSKRYASRDSLKLPWLTLPRDVREKYLRGETVTCSEEEIPNDAPTTELPEGKIEVTPEKTPEPKKPQEEPKTEKTKKVKTLKPKKTESKKSYTKTLQANSQRKAAKKTDSSPQTGDTSNIMGYLVALMMSGAGLAWFGVKRRKSN